MTASDAPTRRKSVIRRVTVFFDGQNFYRNARRAFFDDQSSSSRLGQFWPRAVAELIVRRYDDRELRDVRVYYGRPDRTRDVRGHAANARQSVAWSRSGVQVRPRMLRYPADWPASPAHEKGVDVALATDLVSLTLRGECDVAVIASADSDILPAIEEVQIRTDVTIEVAAWQSVSRRRRQRLSVPGSNVWCHWLSRADYERVRDDTDYTIGRV